MARYGPFVFVVLLALGGLVVALVRSQRRTQSAKSRNVWDYVFLWPVILDQPERRKRVEAGGGFFTTRELVGAALLVVVVVIAVRFF